MKNLVLACCLGLCCAIATAAELSGVFIDDEIKTSSGETLLLNGIGLREKLWVDVYVGALYLPARSSDVAEILSRPGPWRVQLDFEILSRPGPWRVQLDFVYKEVDQKKLIKAWREGFEKTRLMKPCKNCSRASTSFTSTSIAAWSPKSSTLSTTCRQRA
jgi:hypothetical protein